MMRCKVTGAMHCLLFCSRLAFILLALVKQTTTAPHEDHLAALLSGHIEYADPQLDADNNPMHLDARGHLSNALRYQPGAMEPSGRGSAVGGRRASNVTQSEAVQRLLQRLLPQSAHLFQVTIDSSIAVDGIDTVKVLSPLPSGAEGVSVTGSGGVAAAWGVLNYLKQYCKCHISWEADQLNVPQPLPEANFTITSKDRVRYYQNVCTVSYTSVWWAWPRWEREIDWMALNGINLPLAFTGQEAVWRRVYLRMGITEEELQAYFSGPAFLAWFRMGNLMAWGGPLPESWHNATELLQKKILTRMRELGITPVLPCFAGHVPGALKRVFPNANVTRMSRWQAFNDTYSRTYMLEPSDPLYVEIGSMFINEMKATYNYTDGFYNCDPYNELTPSSNDPAYISSVGQAIFGGIQHADATAIWVMQGWMLHYSFWSLDVARPLFTSVPQGRILVLDLSAGISPVYNRFESFFGQPFVFCMLHNYGGVDGLSGYTDHVTKNLATARASNTTMVGTGLTMEGINQNYVMYDLMMDMAWADPPKDIIQWAEAYSTRRYGSDALQAAWRYLMPHVFNNTVTNYKGQHALFNRPSLFSNLQIWYPLSELLSAWDEMVKVANISTAWQAAGKHHLTRTGATILSTVVNAKDLTLNSNSLNRMAKKRGLRLQQLDEANEWNSGKHLYSEKLEKKRSKKRVQELDDINAYSANHIFNIEELEFYRGNTFGEPIASGLDADAEEQPGATDDSDLDGLLERSTRGGNISLVEQPTFQHDLVDVTREVLQDLGAIVVERMIAAYKNSSYIEVMSNGTFLLELLQDLDDLLATSPDFLLGSWTKSAAAWATTPQEETMYVYNALNQITLWGPYPQGNLDYAIKQWAGVVKQYYIPRWEVFISSLLESIVQGTDFDQAALEKVLLEQVENPFTYNTSRNYTSQPVGDSVAVVLELFTKYRPVFALDWMPDPSQHGMKSHYEGVSDHGEEFANGISSSDQ